MPTAIEAQTIYERGWMIRVRPARSPNPERVYLMLHGWTGDEKSMEIFARGLPADAPLYFPRAPLQAPAGGYGWVAHGDTLGSLAEFSVPAGALLAEMDRRNPGPAGKPAPKYCIAGFSQGAALAYTLALLHPDRVRRIAALAGFLPKPPADWQPPDLSGLQVYLAHGENDQTIPICYAREAARSLSAWGAAVDFCENKGGHKLPANCFSALTRFLNA